MNHFPIQLSSIGNCLPDFVERFPSSCHVKDVQTGKYILCNYNIIRALKFESVDDLIGLTVNDLCAEDGIYKKNLNPFAISWRNKEPERIRGVEHQAQTIKRPVSVKAIYFTVDSFIQFESVEKLPILDRDNRKVIAMLTCRQDITLQLGLSKLLRFYREYYPEAQAIQLLLSHLKLKAYFAELPTLQELQILFAMRRDSRHKCVARQLNLALGTVEVYIAKMRGKLRASSNLYDVLIHLRELPIDEKNLNNEHF